MNIFLGELQISILRKMSQIFIDPFFCWSCLYSIHRK